MKPYVGMPWTNSSVPSIGSMIHWNALPARVGGYSSPSTPWSGNHRSISSRQRRSTARSTSVTSDRSGLVSTWSPRSSAGPTIRRASSAISSAAAW